jgi:hypothetical protein
MVGYLESVNFSFFIGKVKAITMVPPSTSEGAVMLSEAVHAELECGRD